MPEKTFDLIVIGGGPGGYVAAIRAAQLGLSTACVDENEQLGGTCLRVGCIPSKALLESSEKLHEARHALAVHGVQVGDVSFSLAVMMERKRKIVEQLSGGVKQLFKSNGVTRLQGRGKLIGPGQVQVDGPEATQEISATRILLATGSAPAPLAGVELDGDRIGASAEALRYDEVPRRLVVIGAGYIGLEMGSVWNRLGSEVIVLEALDRILPGMDAELARLAHRIFEKQGLRFHLGARVKSARVDGQTCRVEVEGGEPIECDRVLLAIGRVPVTKKLGLEDAGVETDDRGHIVVDDAFRTTAADVYAIGDCIRGPKLAHKASHEGLACVENIVGGRGHVNYDAIPGVVYTHPEIASVGKTEEQLKDAGVTYNKGMFPFAASGRAMSLGDTEGRVKVLADKETDRLLGVHILGPRAGDLIAEAGAAIEFGASAEDLGHVCHAHPTLAESLGEAALGALGMAVHMANRKR